MEFNIIDYIIEQKFSMKDLYNLRLARIVTMEINRTMEIDNASEDTAKNQAKIIPINRNRNKDNNDNNNNQSPAA